MSITSLELAFNIWQIFSQNFEGGAGLALEAGASGLVSSSTGGKMMFVTMNKLSLIILLFPP